MASTKTGLSGILRTWMQAHKKPFDFETVFKVCSKNGGHGKDAVVWGLRSFLRRGEVTQTDQGLYLYNQAYESGRPGSPKRDRIYKAIYVINRPFTSADIQRLAGLANNSHVTHLLPALLQAGYISLIGRRSFSKVYRLFNRERFRLELL